jgi:type VI secretion system secreted protein Hcp
MSTKPAASYFSRTLALVPPVLSLTVPQAEAAVDMFLKIEGIPGESVDVSHKEWIQIDSFSWGVSNPGSLSTGGGGGAGKAVIAPLTVGKKIDKSSPLLMLSVCTGQSHVDVTLQVRAAGEDKREPYYVIKFSDVLVSSFQSGASSSADDRPTESVSFNFSKIEVKYFSESATGGVETVEASFNFKEQTSN